MEATMLACVTSAAIMMVMWFGSTCCNNTLDSDDAWIII